MGRLLDETWLPSSPPQPQPLAVQSNRAPFFLPRIRPWSDPHKSFVLSAGLPDPAPPSSSV